MSMLSQEEQDAFRRVVNSHVLSCSNRVVSEFASDGEGEKSRAALAALAEMVAQCSWSMGRTLRGEQRLAAEVRAMLLEDVAEKFDEGLAGQKGTETWKTG